MTRKLTPWNVFVKKVYAEGRSKNPNYKFKQALVDASKRKSEIGNHSFAKSSSAKSKTKTKKNRKSRRRRP